MPCRVEIDKQSCQSSGNCVEAEPSAFIFDEDVLAEPTPAAETLDVGALLAVARKCPAMAIAVMGPDGEELEL
ncbi:ferredoxin [Myxococcota bacterium]|nr:ferredoxin [Myxococcota bacterium]